MNPADDHHRLSVAASASKPLPASHAEEIRESLMPPRKVTVDDHHAFRQSLAPRPRRDPIDELVGYLRTIKPEDKQHR